jgi:hypothetical protein
MQEFIDAAEDQRDRTLSWRLRGSVRAAGLEESGPSRARHAPSTLLFAVVLHVHPFPDFATEGS